MALQLFRNSHKYFCPVEGKRAIFRDRGCSAPCRALLGRILASRLNSTAGSFRLDHYANRRSTMNVSSSSIDWASIGLEFRLSRRELEVARLMYASARRVEIARRLQCSVHTVRTHTDHLFRKLRVGDRMQFGLRIFSTLLTSNRPA